MRSPRSALALGLALPGAALVGLPLVALVWKAPWSRAVELLAAPGALAALRLSLVSSMVAAALTVVLGLPLAWVQARVAYRGRGLVRALITLPIVLPPVSGGVALLLAFGRRGLVGQWLDRGLGLGLPFTPAGVVLAQTFVALPFLVLTTEAGLRALDTRLEDAARTLGASRAEVFRRVTLPLLAPSLAAGAALSWARALGEFGATITFAGNVAGRTQTLPLAVFLALQGDPESAVVLSLVLVAVSVAVLVGLRRHWAPGLVR
ncbi:MAG: ABC transporter permease [Actinobacteria bacterium]|nr:ABC transporter permease [Actinomycetota bacterium]